MMNPRNALPMRDRLAEMFLRKKVFKFLHLPVQSASDSLLADMGRGYTVDDFRSILSVVRRAVPEVTLSTDLIVGYPGETAAHHRMNLDLISEVRPDIVNVTRFSSRPGTKAASSPDHVVGWRAKDRSREIAGLRFGVALERNRTWVGRTVRVLATERGKNRSTIMRTDEYKQVVVPSAEPLGRFYSVRIADATPTYLKGELRGAG
jgi:tRNA A37 methylthiotransferase MiaB